jgi:hypothetical protein
MKAATSWLVAAQKLTPTAFGDRSGRVDALTPELERGGGAVVAGGRRPAEENPSLGGMGFQPG